ncbi:MAG: metallophosphoesterase [Candidatus Pacearchaeota archaeon]
MKIFAFTDIHGEPKYIKKLLAKIKIGKPDVIICAGDISNFSYGLRTILKKFNIGIPFLIIPGNHELPEEIYVYSKEFKSIKDIHLKHFIIGNVFFIGCGGGGFTKKHAEFEQSEKKFAESIKKLKLQDHKYSVVLVTHQPPYKTELDKIYNEYSGSRSIRKFIEKNQPAYCICGHIHENEGKTDKIGETIILNPGHEGKIIEL